MKEVWNYVIVNLIKNVENSKFLRIGKAFGKGGVRLEGSCLRELQNRYNELKGAEKKIAEFLLRNPKDVIHLSITELAEKCGVGEATVVRICKKIGCKGFQELKIRIASEVVNPQDDIYEEVRREDDTLVMMQKVFQSNIVSLSRTLQMADQESMRKAIEIVSQSGSLSFFGMGGSAATALDAYHKFLRTGKRCEVHEDSHFQAMVGSLYTSKDCIIAISNTGSNKELVENVRLARENGVKIISITSNVRSPLSKVSDVVLNSYGVEQKMKSEAMSSRISALSLLDCLYVGVCLQSPETYFDSVGKIRKAIATKRF